MPPYNLSPSRIARYFYHECPRHLRYHATPRDQRDSQGTPQPIPKPGLVTEAILERGYVWEETVIGEKLRGQVHIANGTGPLRERTHGVQETLTRLRLLKPGEFLYQATLEVPPSFLQRYGLDETRYRFSPCRPDLLQLTEDDSGHRTLRVIDVKASTVLKGSHRIQTLLYSLILREVLATAALPLQADLRQAGIWLYEQEAPEWFDSNTGIRIVERFLREDLATIFDKPAEAVPWHLFFRCEWCEFYAHCRNEAEATGSVSLLPYLSVGGRQYLREAPWGGTPIHTLTDFQRFLTDDQRAVDTLLDACGSLRGKRDRLHKGIQALQEQRVIPYGGSSLALPINEQVKVIVTLQSDPHSGQIYAAGFLRLKGQDVYGTGSHHPLFVAATPEDGPAVQSAFLEALFRELQILHDYNKTRPWEEQKSLQVYVFDGYEQTLWHQWLLEAVQDPALAPQALALLFYFQDPGLAGEEEHPEPEVPYPTVVLTQVIRQLVALPQPLVLRLPEVLKALPAPDFPYVLEPRERFWFELSNTLKSDALFQAWQGTHPDAIGGIEGELKRRLWATSAVVDGLRAQVRERLFAWPMKFLLPGAMVFIHEALSQLTFIVRYEAFMQALNTRNQRTAPWEERVRDGISLPVRYGGGDRWQLLCVLDISELEENDFPDRLLVPAGEIGEQAQMSYNDYAYRRAFFSQPKKHRWVAAIHAIEPPNDRAEITHIHVEIKGQHTFQIGDEAVLHPRFTDHNSDRIVTGLGEWDHQPDNDLVTLLDAPREFSVSVNRPPAVRDALQTLSQAGFTPSQGNAFRHLVAQRLTLVWGPPGTGKTYFLARAILALAEAYEQAGQILRIGVTAFTHAAIENLLLELLKEQANTGLGTGLTFHKLKEVTTQRAKDRDLAVLPETDVATLERGVSRVFGATVYSLLKARRNGGLEPLDLLLVDEASQMKFGEFALALDSLRSSQGRLVLAGDDLQLPPLINGQYPVREDGLPGLQDSVFAYLRARDDPASPYTWQLLENWRMNATLSRFPAEQLYGEDYRPATPAIGAQRIRLSPEHTDPAEEYGPLLDTLLDPAFPLVVAILEGVQAAQENRLEAECVARLAAALRRRLHQPQGGPYPDSEAGDSLFWREGLFIVSPHHAQIRAIHRALGRCRPWRTTPFVDTVDKMQGQQSQTVIVSYGVSDVETALQEGSFIYSLNRLNVSITRARAKCVVFLPRPLLEPSFEVWQNEEAAAGLGLMQALLDFCAAGDGKKSFNLVSEAEDLRATLTVLRV